MPKFDNSLNDHSTVSVLTFVEVDKYGKESNLGQIHNITSELIPKVGEFLSLEIYTLDEGGLEIDAQLVTNVQRFMTVIDKGVVNKIFVTIKGK